MITKPDFNDPRNRARALTAIQFAETFFKRNQSRAISRSLFYTNLGNTSRNPGAWLKNFLFEVADDHYNMATGQCKKYRVKPNSTQALRQQLGLEQESDTAPEIQEQIQSGEFEYQEKSDRYYNQVQFIPSGRRKRLLAENGYRYLYDIEAAAPTVLYQRAQQVNANFAAPALHNYILNRTQMRQQIAIEASVSVEQTKLVINAVLQGSVLSTYHASRLYHEMDYDYALIQRLKQSQTLTALRKDIKSLWQCLRGEFEREYYLDKNNVKKTKRLSSRDKSAYYRRLENEVARVIQKYLRQQRIRFLWVHDGWQSDNVIDPNELIARVRQQTGFVIQLDYTMLEEQ